MGGKNDGKRSRGKPWRRWGNNIKWILNKLNDLLQIGFIWLL